MGASEKSQGPGARVVAALASMFVFAAGAVTLTYVCVVRGSGFQAELAGVHGPELMILGGSLVLLTAVAFVVVSVLAGRRAGGSKLRNLLHRARQMDVTDPGALKEFDAVPDLRDMVAELVTERAHARELSDRFEGLRHEVDGIVEGMRRSVEDGERLREESPYANVVQLAVLWNDLVDRMRDAQQTRSASAPMGSEQTDAGGPEITGLVARLDELESELGRLRSAVGTPTVPSPARRLWDEPEDQQAFAGPAPVVESASSRDWDDIEVEDEDETVGWNPPSEPAPQPLAQPTRPARELFLDDDTFGSVEGYVEVASEPEMGPREARRMPDPFAPHSLLPSGLADAPESSFHEQPGDSPYVEEDMQLPTFVSDAVKSAQGRVELTYENQDPDEVVELPASALLFENNAGDNDGEPPSEEAVYDLRSFGATENDQ